MAWRNAKRLRAGLGLLVIIFALLGMLLPRTVMSMPVAIPDMTHAATHEMTMQHHMGAKEHSISMDHIVFPHDRHDRCQCSGHCTLCGTCHSTLSSALISDFNGLYTVPAGPRLASVIDIYLSPDPHPPRV